MRDINRIEELLAQIELVWKRSPDLRLGQLIETACAHISVDRRLEGKGAWPVFYIEDEALIEYFAGVNGINR
jgi:uncharacterized protein YihD (DUF1040 family)